MQSRTSRNSGVLAKRTLCEQGIRTSRSGNFEDLNSDVRFLVQVRVDGQFVLSKQQIRPDPYSGRRRRPVQPKCSRDVDLARARELKLLYRGQYVHEMLLAIHARWEPSNCADGSVLGSSSTPGVSPTRRVQVALFGSESHHSRYSCSDAHQDLDRRHRCQRASSPTNTSSSLAQVSDPDLRSPSLPSSGVGTVKQKTAYGRMDTEPSSSGSAQWQVPRLGAG